jgi:15-cis-phytoene synthase
MMADSDIAACRALLRGGSRTFHAASLVLPRKVADPAIALYAFCRLADDAVDIGHDNGRDRAAAVARLRDRLDWVYRGQPLPHPADRAFASVVGQFAIPRALPEALLEGLEWDAQSRRYVTLNDLQTYAARVAGSVGAMMTLVMGPRAPDVVARACDLGVAMQLTNIARDIGEDARAGRLYLPLQWFCEAGIDPEVWLARPCFSPAIAAMTQRLLDAADELYVRARVGIAQLPLACRPGIHAAGLLYAEIGRAVERAGLDSMTQRAVVPTSRKLSVLARRLALTATGMGSPTPSDHAIPALAETQFLIDAIVAQPHGPPLRRRVKPVEDRVVWVLDLFTRLEQRDQLQRRRA